MRNQIRARAQTVRVASSATSGHGATDALLLQIKFAEQIGVLRQDVERTRELLTRERDHRLKVVLPKRFQLREVRVLPLALVYLIPATAEDVIWAHVTPAGTADSATAR